MIHHAHIGQGSVTIAKLQDVVRNEEGALGELTAIEIRDGKTIGTFDDNRDPPGKAVVHPGHIDGAVQGQALILDQSQDVSITHDG